MAEQAYPLPDPSIKRWSPRRKATVVIAVAEGRIGREEACRRYQLSAEELLDWEDAFKEYGYYGLHVTGRQQHRRDLETLPGSLSGRSTRMR